MNGGDARDAAGAPSSPDGALSRAGPRGPEVTVHRIALDATRPPDARAVAELSDAERARAARFASTALRDRWLWGHVALRRILARALDVAPARVAYGTGESGKPFLAAPSGTGIEFSYSDSGDLALVALSTGGPVGVDVEACRPRRDVEAIAASHFAPAEREALRALPEAERLSAFYRIWTRKEAYLKALGVGLSHGLGRFVVTHTEADAHLVSVVGGSRGTAPMWLRSVAVPAGYAAAVAHATRATPRIADWVDG